MPQSGLTPAYLKENFLQGIPLEDKQGKPLGDGILSRALDIAEDELHTRYGLLWQPTTVVLGPVPTDKYTPLPKVITGHGPDYEPHAWQGNTWSILQLPYYPIVRLDYLGLGLGAGAPKEVMSFPAEWHQLDKQHGVLRLFPAWRGTTQAGITSFMLGVLNSGRVIPQAFRVAYQAGYSNVLSERPWLAWMLGASATVRLLPTLALLRGGLISSQSVSVDGLSQSVSLPVSGQTHMYSPYQSSLEAQIKESGKLFFRRRNASIFSA